MARQVAERQHRADQLSQQLQDRDADIQVLKRKHTAAIKELQRELALVRKQLEASAANAPTFVVQNSSRASSSTSLDYDSERQQTPPPTSITNAQVTF